MGFATRESTGTGAASAGWEFLVFVWKPWDYSGSNPLLRNTPKDPGDWYIKTYMNGWFLMVKYGKCR